MKTNKLFEDVFMDIDWSLYDDETAELPELEKKIYSDMVYTHHPKTKVELIAAIKEELANDNADLNCINTSDITDMSWLFDKENGIRLSAEQQKDLDVSEWDVRNVESMRYMFRGCTKFNQDLSKWDVGKAESMRGMFSGCTDFDQDLSGWDVGNVEDMGYMFNGCTKFNQNISGWDVRNVKDTYCMFSDCTDFDQDLSGWDVSNVRGMYGMFSGCTKLEENGLIPDWLL